MSINAISGSVRNLENAVYYIDSKGRYASLPANNSMRIDLLSSRLSWLVSEVESTVGTDNTGKFNSIVDYIEHYTKTSGTDNHIDHFPAKTYGPDKEIIDVNGSSATYPDDYTTIQSTLQTLFNHSGAADTSTGITASDVDATKDGYLIDNGEGKSYITNEPIMSKSDLVAKLSKYPDIFKYLYQTMVYTYDRVMYLQKQFNVFENMDNSLLDD